MARGFVRQEAQQISAAHQQIRHIPDELGKMVADRFRGRRRLSASSLNLLAGEIDKKAGCALSSVLSSRAHRASSKARPNAIRYDIVHYLVEAVPQPLVAGTTPKDRIMRLCVFSAMLDQRAVTMRLRETPLCFWEHAARRYLVRGGEEHEAAVRAIARRLASTFILPSMVLNTRGAAAEGSTLAIPFADGLLLGGFQASPRPENSGGLVTFNRYCMQQRTIPYGISSNFVVKTYVNPRQLSPDQREVAREMEAWLASHQEAAEAAIMQFYRVDDSNETDIMAPEAWKRLKADFLSMWSRLSGVLSPLGHFDE
ncbi:hypothetical protein [Sphingobium sp.]|uniref:hypothetical protein n=1 Tax=Sphingobium sp. TaxID=1912891 RepID=UPI0029C043BC|nr:hypothetical protein [Sphingobium sp.]